MEQTVPSIPPSVRVFFPDAQVVWPKVMKPGRPIDQINQICIVVDDIEKAVGFFSAAYGWGPFYRAKSANTQFYNGAMNSFELELAFALVGTLEIELVQVVFGQTPHADFIRDKGAGFFHIRLEVDSIEEELEYLRDLGVTPVWEYSSDGQYINAYLSSDQYFGLKAELVLPEAKIRELLKNKAMEWLR